MELKHNSNGNRPAGSIKRPEVAIVGEVNPDLILDGLPRELAEDRELLASRSPPRSTPTTIPKTVGRAWWSAFFLTSIFSLALKRNCAR